ncbi:hypothetical protein [Tersicoccus phoenicis]|uniref:hypothetical protein n=1 Tax=Tersicoccus phoenicis TaxID=554083 RepID=UPI0011800104|nr:hypothetical protein [Tersicoccus phoenicis]
MTVLDVLGFIVPVSAAVTAYFNVKKTTQTFKSEETTWGDMEEFGKRLPGLMRDRLAAVKWPAIVAVFGVACSTAASILSTWCLS